RPPLSKGYLRGQERFEDQLVNPAGYYAEQKIELRLGARATAIDPGEKLVELEGGERIAYDRLLVATGGRNRPLSTPGAGLDGVFQLRTVEDCDRIRAAAQPGRRAVVIGILANSEVLAAAGAAVENGVLVDERCRTSLPDVWAAGDVANHLHPLFGRLRVEHWNNGYRQGRAAARSLLGDEEPYDYLH